MTRLERTPAMYLDEEMEDREDRDFQVAMRLRPRCVSEERLRRFEGYMAEIFSAFGMDLHTPSTEKTPQRFIRAL